MTDEERRLQMDAHILNSPPAVLNAELKARLKQVRQGNLTGLFLTLASALFVEEAKPRGERDFTTANRLCSELSLVLQDDQEGELTPCWEEFPRVTSYFVSYLLAGFTERV